MKTVSDDSTRRAKATAVYALVNSHDGERSARRGAMKNAALYLIDGEYVDAATLTARLGVDKQRALAKVSRAKKKPGPLTWAKLGVTP